jgi:uncharacterized protein
MSHAGLVAWAGLLIGVLFGAIGNRTGFCLVSALRSAWREGDRRGLQAFTLALAVAVAGTHWLDDSGLISLRAALYLQPNMHWHLYLLGGVLFGYGMVLANGCGARALVLLATGNLRSLLVLLCIGIGGAMTLSGLLAPLRLLASEFWVVRLDLPRPSPVGLLQHWTTLPGVVASWAPVALVSGALLLHACADRRFLASPPHWLGGLGVGLLIVAGWFVTGHLGADDFEPVAVASLTFVAPVSETLQYIMLSTGMSVRFGVAVVAGVVLGSLLVTLWYKRFWLQGFGSAPSMLRYIAGGLLMGVGGALALGCSIGQGLTGLSTLSFGSMLAVAGLLLGTRLGLRPYGRS